MSTLVALMLLDMTLRDQEMQVSHVNSVHIILQNRQRADTFRGEYC